VSRFFTAVSPVPSVVEAATSSTSPEASASGGNVVTPSGIIGAAHAATRTITNLSVKAQRRWKVFGGRRNVRRAECMSGQRASLCRPTNKSAGRSCIAPPRLAHVQSLVVPASSEDGHMPAPADVREHCQREPSHEHAYSSTGPVDPEQTW
jgi:hypothetical protein